MKKVETYSETSKMIRRNVCLMFAGNLFRMHSLHPSTELAHYEIKIELCGFLMTYTSEIFGQDLVNSLSKRVSSE